MWPHVEFALETQLWESKLLIAAIKIDMKKTYNEESGPV